MTLFKRIPTFLLALTLLITTSANADTLVIPADTTLIILRHADRYEEDLNARGIARAAALPGALAGVAIDAIYSPDLKRNLDTAAPLAAERGLSVTTRATKNVAAAMFADNPGKTIVWVGNKGNINVIWDDIGAQDPPPLAYGDLFIVRPDASGNPVVTRKTYGVVAGN
ncbi:MAG: histidine phosphatase family protein [Marinosulfonomonas sp.]|nr:histidine phosphatase family protein [Marinosulfonomonas sp.]